eukprot:TRINITY_DN66815_c7_g1_i1.p1 TRINITY_DN66815_c7_g1~~TRINITY_DN66815_c7_g1_i1.p1  ORF type:complete len:945 (+),score=87.51 TRINITY_DN66815_c7_g1_i1:303-2837(+)
MNLPFTSVDRVEDYIILHEFGHVLGFYHEHCHPTLRINVDEARIVFAKRPYRFSEERIEAELQQKVLRPNHRQDEPDAHSIMCYPIGRLLECPEGWSPERHEEFVRNMNEPRNGLSDKDKDIAEYWYPDDDDEDDDELCAETEITVEQSNAKAEQEALVATEERLRLDALAAASKLAEDRAWDVDGWKGHGKNDNGTHVTIDIEPKIGKKPLAKMELDSSCKHVCEDIARCKEKSNQRLIIWVLFDGTENTSQYDLALCPQQEQPAHLQAAKQTKRRVTPRQLEGIFQAGKYTNHSNIAIMKDLICLTANADKDYFALESTETKLSHGTLHRIVADDNKKHLILYFEGAANRTMSPQEDLLLNVKHAFTTLGVDEAARGFRQSMDNLIVMGFGRGAVQATLLCHVLGETGGFFRDISTKEVGKLFSPFRGMGITFQKRLERECKKLIRPSTLIKAKVTFLGVYDQVVDPLPSNHHTSKQHCVSDTILGDLLKTPPSCCKQVAHAVSLYEYNTPYPYLFTKGKGKRANVEEQWWPGYHRDIGGGSAKEGCHLVSSFTLGWMMDKFWQTTNRCSKCSQRDPKCETCVPLKPIRIEKWHLLKDPPETEEDSFENNYLLPQKPDPHMLAGPLEAPLHASTCRHREPPQDATISLLAVEGKFLAEAQKYLDHLLLLRVGSSEAPPPFSSQALTCHGLADAVQKIAARGAQHYAEPNPLRVDLHRLHAHMATKMQQLEELHAHATRVQAAFKEMAMYTKHGFDADLDWSVDDEVAMLKEWSKYSMPKVFEELEEHSKNVNDADRVLHEEIAAVFNQKHQFKEEERQRLQLALERLKQLKTEFKTVVQELK